MILTVEYDLYKVKMDQHAKYLGYESFCSNVILRTHTHTHKHRSDRSTWTTKVVGKFVQGWLCGVQSFVLILGRVGSGRVKKSGPAVQVWVDR